ncbi:membrane protein [Streptomyces glaucosporus]|uniref:Membrane protein n=1 Tax=Streptomyces glaucosporus TaxID=284044 RepID=A0ABP5UU94_9ACTN
MNPVARHIGRTLALVLPVVLVLSGTLAVTRVSWAPSPYETQVLTASSERTADRGKPRAPHEVVRDRLVAELQEKDPGAALTSLQEEMNRRPSLAKHCTSIARALGRAAVRKYGSAHRAHAYSRPVCDTSFAAGIAESR